MTRVVRIYRIVFIVALVCLPVMQVASQDDTATDEPMVASSTPLPPTATNTAPPPTPTVVAPTATQTPVPPTATSTSAPPTVTYTMTAPPIVTTEVMPSVTIETENVSVTPTLSSDTSTEIPPTEIDNGMSAQGMGEVDNVTPIVITAETDTQPIVTPVVEEPSGPARITANIISDIPAENRRLVTIAVTGDNLHHVYGMSLKCHTNPSFFNGLQALPGELFPPASSIRVDNGFQMDGVWLFGAYLRNPAEPISGNGTLFLINGEVRVETEVSVECTSVLASRTGDNLPVENDTLNIIFNKGEQRVVATNQPITPPRPPTAIPQPTLEPTSTLSILPTYDPERNQHGAEPDAPDSEPTESTASNVTPAPPDNQPDAPVVTSVANVIPTEVIATSTPVQLDINPDGTVRVEGFVASTIGLNSVTVTIISDNTQGQISLDRSSSYQFSVDLKPGNYTFVISGAHHLSTYLNIEVMNMPFSLPLVTLLNGDINEDGIIDLEDGTLLSASYGMTNYFPNADLNEDGTVDIFDMAIFSGNYGEQAK